MSNFILKYEFIFSEFFLKIFLKNELILLVNISIFLDLVKEGSGEGLVR